MSQEIPRRCLGTVQLRPQHGSQVPDGDLHGVGDAAFRLPRDVVRRPGEDNSHGGVDACCGEEGAQVGDSGSVLGEEEDVADYGDDGGAHDERGAKVGAFGEDGDDD